MVIAPRYPRPAARARTRPGNGRHTVLAIMGVVAVFAVAFLVMSPKSPFTSLLRPPPPGATEADAEIYTGTIQLGPSHSNLCRQLAFDNRTGEMHDKGLGSCARLTIASNGGEPERYWRNNIDKVREGFVRR